MKNFRNWSMMIIAMLLMLATTSAFGNQNIPQSLGCAPNYSTANGLSFTYNPPYFEVANLYTGAQLDSMLAAGADPVYVQQCASMKAIILGTPYEASPEGTPNTPGYSISVLVPLNATGVVFKVTSQDTVYRNVDLAPGPVQGMSGVEQAQLYKNPNAYRINAMIPNVMAAVSPIYIRHYSKYVSVAIHPTQYNPVTGDLIVHRNMRISLSWDGSRSFGTTFAENDYAFRSQFINGEMLDDDRDGTNGPARILAYRGGAAYLAELIPLRNMLVEMGKPTLLVDLDTYPGGLQVLAFDNYFNAWLYPDSFRVFEGITVANGTSGQFGVYPFEYVYGSAGYHAPTFHYCEDIMQNDSTGGSEIFVNLLGANSPDDLHRMVSRFIEAQLRPSTTVSYNSPVIGGTLDNGRGYGLPQETIYGWMARVIQPIRCYVDGYNVGPLVWGNLINQSFTNNWLNAYGPPPGLGYVAMSPVPYLYQWIYSIGTAKSTLIAANGSGTNYINWLGYGDPTSLSGCDGDVLSISDIANLAHPTNAPALWLLNADSTARYTHPGGCFAEKLMTAGTASNWQQRGALIAIGNSGPQWYTISALSALGDMKAFWPKFDSQPWELTRTLSPIIGMQFSHQLVVSMHSWYIYQYSWPPPWIHPNMPLDMANYRQAFGILESPFYPATPPVQNTWTTPNISPSGIVGVRAAAGSWISISTNCLNPNITIQEPILATGNTQWFNVSPYTSVKVTTRADGAILWQRVLNQGITPDKNWDVSSEDPIEQVIGLVPDTYGMQAAPNPFNPSTEIKYQLAESGYVTLQVYDIAGRMVGTLVDGYRTAGEHAVKLDGSSWASGQYIVRFSVNGQTASSTVTLMK